MEELAPELARQFNVLRKHMGLTCPMTRRKMREALAKVEQTDGPRLRRLLSELGAG